jgi:hypothetical protein
MSESGAGSRCLCQACLERPPQGLVMLPVRALRKVVRRPHLVVTICGACGFIVFALLAALFASVDDSSSTRRSSNNNFVPP